jgi:DNA invertase Pin-like site-specific DNA recombinase
MNALHNETKYTKMIAHTFEVHRVRVMDVIFYLRVSTTEQADSGLGLAAQQSTLELTAKHRDWNVVETCVDAGATGKNMDRPGLTHALHLLRTKQADCLACAKLDRVSRSVVDFAQLIELSRKEKWSFVAIDLNVDTSTPTGELLANVMMSVAQWERRAISERTSAALRALQARGVTLGRPVVVSPATAEMVGRWRAAGCSWQACAHALNDQGVPTAHGGRQWYASTVRKVWQSHERRQAVA